MIYLKANSIAKAFHPLKLFTRITSNSLDLQGLSGRFYTIKKSPRRTWDLTISTADVSDEVFDFLINFFLDCEREISFDGENFEAVSIAGNDLSVEYIEECRLLPQFHFHLMRRSPSAEKLPGE